MKALTAAEMREVDRLTTERYGIPGLDLMEAAGSHVETAVRGQGFSFRRDGLVVLCGKGNNGGDGFVAARLLKGAKFEPVVCLFGRREEVRGDAAKNLDRWIEESGEILEVTDAKSLDEAWKRIAKAQALVDALLGTGLRGPATGLIAEVIRRINELSRNATLARPSLIIAVDIPSGLPSDGEATDGPVLHAHQTITFTAPKIGQLISKDAGCCGELKVRQIGSPAALIEEIGKGSARWAEPSEFAAIPMVRAADSHKGTYGHVLLLAGSAGKSGAAILAGRAALRGGAGLVTVAAPETVQPLIAAGAAELMTEPLKATKSGKLALQSLVDGTFGELEEGKSVLAIGPGLGTHKQTQEFIRTIVAQTELPVVLDADGLNAFAGKSGELHKRKTPFLCVTPHPGEMARLLGVSTSKVQVDRLGTALNAAQKWNAHVVLKGFHTIIATPKGEIFVNTTGGPALAKGGSGDVLTGLLAALTSQFRTDDWGRVLALGVYLHGDAAAVPMLSPDASGFLAHEIADTIPQARRRLLAELRKSG
jgi:NAD(P)H-hydrate epimerase